MRDRILFIAASVPLFFCACAGNTVKVAYPLPGNPAMREKAHALGNLYLLIRKPVTPGGNLEGKGAKTVLDDHDALNRSAFPVDAGHFARKLAQGLDRRGAQLIAYRVAHRRLPAPAAPEDAADSAAPMDADPPTDLSVEGDPFLDRLAPSGILLVDFQSLDLTRERVEREVKFKTDSGTETVRTERYWKFTARMGLRARLSTHPAGKILDDFAHEFAFEGELPRKENVDTKRRHWYASVQPAMLDKGADELQQRFGRIPVLTRGRELHVDKKEPDSAAARAAWKVWNWEEASLLWARRLEQGKGGWRDIMNLAVAAEKRREFAEALRVYRKARDAAADDPEALKIPWLAIFSELENALESIPSRSTAAVAWFSAPVAVLPFSDVTMSIDGPENLRALAAEGLRAGGYQVLPAEEVDRTLRDHGVSVSRGLAFASTRNYSDWLSGARILYGHILTFDDIMLGFYGRRSVAGKLTLWSPEEGKVVWRSEESVENESLTINAKEAGAAFAGQLLQGLLERIRSKPLGPESALFIRQNLETLPLRP